MDRRFDLWRQRQLWLPAWLDDKDWKTWCWHAVFTVGVGLLFYALGRLVLGQWVPILLIVGAWGMVAYYGIWEYRVRQFEGWGYKRLDGFMDVLLPVIAAIGVMIWFGRS